MFDLVMIPAFGCDARLYATIAPALADIIRPLTIMADGATFTECVGQILASAPDRFVLLGTSFGGRVAMELAVRSPERVAGLVVVGSGAGPSPDVAAGVLRSTRLRNGGMEGVLAEMGEKVAYLPGPNGPATRDAFIAMGRDRGAEAMARQSDALACRGDLRPLLSAVTCPALMLWGTEDAFSPASDGLALSTLFANARYAEISECGHFPALEAPEETAGILRHWLVDSGLT